jgi:alanine dehydrogenase
VSHLDWRRLLNGCPGLRTGDVATLVNRIIKADDVRTELGEVIVGLSSGRSSEEDITLFESVGMGLQYLATAQLVIAHARALGVGATVELSA